VLFDPEGAAPTLREFMEAVKNDATKIINKSGTRIDTNKLNWHDVSFSQLYKQGFASFQRPTASNQFAVPKVDITGKQSDARARVPGRFQPIETPNPSIGADETPITTWGQIDGTPFPLDGSNMTPLPANVPSYKLPEMTKREIVAHEMAEKLKRQNKVKKEFSKRLTDRLK
jgi:hypothetical protein